MNNSHELRIERLDDEGVGQAYSMRADGTRKQVIVPFTLPEESVLATVYKDAKRPCRLVAVQVKSPIRQQPRCIHFGSCGGCRFQHMPYKAQAAFKEEKIKKLFSQYVPFILPLIEAHSEWNYRNKMQWSFSQDLEGNTFLGLVLHAARGRVCNITECHLVPSWMVELVAKVREWWVDSSLTAYYPPKNSGTLQALTCREGSGAGDRVVILTVSGSPEFAIKRRQLDSFVQLCLPFQGKAELTVVLRIHQQCAGRPTQWFEMRLFGPESFRQEYSIGDRSVEFHVSPSSFLQPNSQMACVIYNKAFELAKLDKNDVLYDLYAGIGVFGILSAPFVKQVVAIELDPDAAYDAVTNVNRLGLSNVSVFKGDVSTLLREGVHDLPTVCFIDPPRTGLGKKMVDELVRLGPMRIIYVSCNPKTQSIDVDLLVGQGYEVVAIQPIDQFAQTVHVENIISLRASCKTRGVQKIALSAPPESVPPCLPSR